MSSGSEAKIKVWDIRMMKELYNYWSPKPATKLSVSQRGLLAASFGGNCIVWKDWNLSKQKAPYMKQETKERRIISHHQFVNFEDFLGVGVNGGFETW